MQVDELLQKCAPGAAAKWGLCVLLFTSKATTAPMFTALANQFHGKIAFGEVHPTPPPPFPPSFDARHFPWSSAL